MTQVTTVIDRANAPARAFFYSGFVGSATPLNLSQASTISVRTGAGGGPPSLYKGGAFGASARDAIRQVRNWLREGVVVRGASRQLLPVTVLEMTAQHVPALTVARGTGFLLTNHNHFGSLKGVSDRRVFKGI